MPNETYITSILNNVTGRNVDEQNDRTTKLKADRIPFQQMISRISTRGIMVILASALSFWMCRSLFNGSLDSDSIVYSALPFLALGFPLLLIIDDPLELIFYFFPFTLMYKVQFIYLAIGTITIILTILGSHFKALDQRRMAKFDSRFIVIVALAGFVGVLASPEKAIALGHYASVIVLPLGMYAAIVTQPRGAVHIERFMMAMVYAFAIIGVGSLYVKLTNPAITRPGGFFNQYPTVIGQTAAAVLPFCYLRISRVVNPLNISLLIFVFIAMLLTNTRMAVITTGLGLLFYPRLWLRLLFPALVLLLAKGWMVKLGFLSRLEAVTSGGVEESVLSRFMAWDAAIKLIRQHPWTGIGFLQFQHVYTKAISISFIRLEHAHNLILATCVDFGIPGLLAYLGSVAAVIIRGFKKIMHPFCGEMYLPERKALLVASIVFLGSGVADALFVQPAWTMVFWTFLGGIRRFELEATAVRITTSPGHNSC